MSFIPFEIKASSVVLEIQCFGLLLKAIVYWQFLPLYSVIERYELISRNYEIIYVGDHDAILLFFTALLDQ